MRLIDADAMIDRLKEWDTKDKTDKALYNFTLNRINEQPTIHPEPHWIPVTERLPEVSGCYLVSGKWGSGKESVGECEFSVEDGYFQTAWNFDVLAWMPLPETYKEETE